MKIQSELSQATDGSFHAISFKVSDEEYGLSLATISEIVRLPRITRVPKVAHYVRGVINLHGKVIPVVDLARRYDIGTTRTDSHSRIVVVETPGELVGLIAERVGRVTRLDSKAMQPAPHLLAGIAAGFLDGVVHMKDRFLIFPNLERTLNSQSSAEQTNEQC